MIGKDQALSNVLQNYAALNYVDPLTATEIKTRIDLVILSFID